MKMLSTGRVSLLGVVLACAGISDAVRETITVTEGGVTFTVALRDDARHNPYRLKVQQDDSFSLFMFDYDTLVTSIKIGKDEEMEEGYKVMYDSSNNFAGAELRPSTRRALAEEEQDTAVIEGRRLDFDDCTVCEGAWVALCAGASSVCDLVDFGSPFSTTAAASIDTVCETFGSACSNYEASEACEGQCNIEEVASSSCLDPTSGDYKCTFTGDTSLEFSDCNLVDDDVPFLPACFEEFGKTNIQELTIENNFDLTSYAEGTFAGLSEMTFLDICDGGLVTVQEGLFDGLTKLEFLDLSENNLVSLPEGAFSDLASLQTLRLRENELTSEGLPLGLFSGVPQLQSLDFWRNSLKDMTGLEGLLDGLTELTFLSFADCLIDTVPEGLLSGLTKLERLTFEKNSLVSLPDGLFSDLTALDNLILSINNVTDFGTSLTGLPELNRLGLDCNELVTVSEGMFDGLPKLEFLALSENDLVSLPEGSFSGLSSLQTLTLDDNELTAESLAVGLFSAVPRLQHLQMNRNSLGDMTGLEGLFDGLTELLFVSMAESGITVVPEGLLAGLTSLGSLNLPRNRLTSLPDGFLSGLTSLVFLGLGFNDLVLTEDVFSDLTNVTSLNLPGCGLTTLPAGIFSPLVNLERLDLEENEDLQCLPSSTATFIDIEEGVEDGTCGCTPVEAVFCDDGLSCQSGMTGYTCVA